MKRKQKAFGCVRGSLLLLSLAMIALISACAPKTDQASSDMQSQSLYAHKTPYAGDNSKVGNILSQLYWTKEYSYSAFEIQSESEPYGLLISLDMSEPIPFPTKDDHSALLSNAAILLALADNLDYVQYQDLHGENFILSRDDVDKFIKDRVNTSNDTASYGSSAEKFEELFLSMGYPWSEELLQEFEQKNLQQISAVTDKYLPDELTEDLDLFDYKMYQTRQNIDEMSFIKYMPSIDDYGNLLKVNFSSQKDKLTYYRVKDYGYWRIVENEYNATGRYFYHTLEGDFSLLKDMAFDLSGSGNKKSMVTPHPERIEKYTERFAKKDAPEKLSDLVYCKAMTAEEAQKLANEFVHDFVDPDLQLNKTVFVDDDYQDYFSDESEQYLVHVNLDFGFVQVFQHIPR